MRGLRPARGALLSGALAAAPASAQFDPAYEARNFSKTNERAAIHSTPEYKALLAQVTTANTTEAAQIAAADPERSFVGQTLCWSYGEGCAGDARLYDWVPKDYGQVRPVVFTARNGATLGGRVWFTRAGPVKRPGVVIVNGSVQAPETLYWFAAQTLAKAAISKEYSAAGVDTGSIAIRGGTHYEFSWIPDPAFPAALRGADLTTWYTTAWFDAYVKGDASASRRLRTDRWRNDAPSAAVDPDRDANMMSRYYRSRLDIGRGGERFVCEDLRAGPDHPPHRAPPLTEWHLPSPTGNADATRPPSDT